MKRILVAVLALSALHVDVFAADQISKKRGRGEDKTLTFDQYSLDKIEKEKRAQKRAQRKAARVAAEEDAPVAAPAPVKAVVAAEEAAPVAAPAGDALVAFNPDLALALSLPLPADADDMDKEVEVVEAPNTVEAATAAAREALDSSALEVHEYQKAVDEKRTMAGAAHRAIEIRAQYAELHDAYDAAKLHMEKSKADFKAAQAVLAEEVNKVEGMQKQFLKASKSLATASTSAELRERNSLVDELKAALIPAIENLEKVTADFKEKKAVLGNAINTFNQRDAEVNHLLKMKIDADSKAFEEAQEIEKLAKRMQAQQAAEYERTRILQRKLVEGAQPITAAEVEIKFVLNPQIKQAAENVAKLEEAAAAVAAHHGLVSLIPSWMPFAPAKAPSREEIASAQQTLRDLLDRKAVLEKAARR